jgi:hypothetical protein
MTDKAFENAKLERVAEIAAIPPDDALTLYIETAKLIDDLEQKTKELKKINTTLEPLLIEYFKDKGQQRVTRNGRTVYLARELWPKVVADDLTAGLTDERDVSEADERAKSRLVDALANDPETSHLVKSSYNTMTLRSFILNDCEEGDDGMPTIPEHLKGKLGVTEVFKAKVLRSN